MSNVESESSLPDDLLCREDDSSLMEPRDDDNDENLELCSVSESDCEFVETLFETETSFQPNNDDNPLRSETIWLKCARSDAIEWILETRDLFGYHYRTAYLSMIYFDRFFTGRRISDIKIWHIRILSIACLSLAAKMEECEVRALTEYKVEGYNFQGNAIQRMELFVLNALDWKMCTVTPFAYLNYFVTKLCDEPRRKEVVIKAGELILAVMEEINVVEHRPSIVAASAVLAAYDNQLTKTVLENKMDSVPSWGSPEKEHTFSCYSILQQILNVKTPKYIISDTDHSTTTTSRGSTKRRLAFTDDQHCPARKFPNP